jgi:DNA-3-methyladenine glycosylase I
MRMTRCGWVNEADAAYVAYHDEEWGVPLRDDRALWELLMLEGFQAGLSWITILRKRPAFRLAFAGFEPARVAKFGQFEITTLLENPDIVRSRAKIEATIHAARVFEEMRASGRSFADFVWDAVDGMPVQNTWRSFRDAPVKTSASETLSKRLKDKGFKFCGPVITYAYMQAAGLVNDHEVTCPRFEIVRAMSK